MGRLYGMDLSWVALDFMVIWPSFFIVPVSCVFSLLRTKMDIFPWCDLVLSGQEEILCRRCNIYSRGECVAMEFSLQKSPLRRFRESGLAQLALWEFCRGPFTHLGDA